jgi:hypothetical protein
VSSYATPLQELLWHRRRQDPSLPWGTIRFTRTLKGDLDVKALRAAFRSVIARHEALRTTFDDRDDQLQRVVLTEDPRPELEVLDLRGVSDEERDVCIAAVRELLAARFELSTGPLIRGKLLQLPDSTWALLFALDHIAFDAASIRIFYQDLWTYYRSFSSHTAPRFAQEVVPFGDFADFQLLAINGPEFAHQRAYWERKLADCCVRLELPLLAERETVTSVRLGSVDFAGLPALTPKIDAFAAKHKATTFSILAAAVAIALTSYGDGESILMTSMWGNRHRFWNKALVGLVVDFVPLSIDASRSRSVLDFVISTRQVIAEAFVNGDISPLLTAGSIPTTFNPPRKAVGTRCGPEVLINYVEGRGTTLTGGADRAMDFESQEGEFPARDGLVLQFFIRRSRAGLTGTIEFNNNLLSSDEAERIARKTERAIETLADQPFAKVRDVAEMASSCI